MPNSKKQSFPLRGFNEISEGIIKSTNRNLVWQFVAPALLIIVSGFILSDILLVLKGAWSLSGSLKVWGIVLAVLSPLLLLPLLAVRSTTTVDFNKRNVQIDRRKFRGKARQRTFPIDDLRVNAVRMGATPDPGSGVSTRERWIVKAGFEYENFDWAVYSQETTSLEECESVMLELYHFFFPSRASVGKENILTNGNQAYLLADEEKESFLRTHGTEGGE